MTLTTIGINLKNYLSTIEVDAIRQALLITDNNKNKAAELLGLQRTTLVMKMKKYGFILNKPLRVTSTDNRELV